MLEHLPEIESWTITHQDQRYDTAGDYWKEPDIPNTLKWCLRVSEMSDWRYEALVLVHELVEMILTTHNGVDWRAIDNFDMVTGYNLADPGADPRAPYHVEHMSAELLERLLAMRLGVVWSEYQEALDRLQFKEAQDVGLESSNSRDGKTEPAGRSRGTDVQLAFHFEADQPNCGCAGGNPDEAGNAACNCHTRANECGSVPRATCGVS